MTTEISPRVPSGVPSENLNETKTKKITLNPDAVIEIVKTSGINANSVMNTLTLLIDEDATVPFIARYRKERTGNLDEVEIRAIFDAYEGILEREKRRGYILDAINKMEALTPELQQQITAATTLIQLEDLYAPYKAKKKTRAMIAKEAGLLPLSQMILDGGMSYTIIESCEAPKFINPDKKIITSLDALKGAQDIILETFAHDPHIKETLRKDYWRDASLVSVKKEGAESEKEYLKYKDYFEFSCPIKALLDEKAGHRFMALRRGVTQKILKVDVVYDTEAAISCIVKKYAPNTNHGSFEVIQKLAEKAVANSIHPSLDLEIKTELKKVSDESAINVFGVNLKNLLLQPYLGPKSVVGIDPGIRTGCKIAVIDNTGKFLVDTVIYPFEPQRQVAASKTILDAIIEQFKVHHIAIGNGTNGRETLKFVEEHIEAVKSQKVKATLVNEAGASIYSASDIARSEFPDKDVTVRGAISIARRFQDPLAELVKIDPKSIGVGQYQHDVNQVKLKKTLEAVVESCVNYVGVDLNTASAPLLSYVSGIGPALAQNIVKHRESKGLFKDRRELLKVTRFTPKVFEQAAGFLRIYNGENPLDATFIHPERYELLSIWAKTKNAQIHDLTTGPKLIDEMAQDQELKQKIGDETLKDIVNSLKAPSQDPREEFKSTEFRKDISDIKHLKIGEWYPGIVTNITQFGAFVDIGIKENGLLHISQIRDQFVENALQVLKVGETLKVKVIEIDYDRKRIALSAKSDSKANYPTKTHSPHTAPHTTQDNRQNRGKLPPTPELKNNAFAALKGLKLK